MLVKICGIKDIENALVAVENGVDVLGFVFAPSSRQLTPEKAKKIIDTIPAGVLRVGVFVDAAISLVKEIAEYCALTILQLHGNESVDYCRQFKNPVIKAIRIGGKGIFYPSPELYKETVKAFLASKVPLIISINMVLTPEENVSRSLPATDHKEALAFFIVSILKLYISVSVCIRASSALV